MLKNILNLEGVHELSKNEQKSILAGVKSCNPIFTPCTDLGYICYNGECVRIIPEPSSDRDIYERYRTNI